jgi:glycosyltransferase involved in cell wall biosynthesis
VTDPASPTTPASPTVSVVIPVYRAAAHIGHCIDSLAEQTQRPTEILLVDDHGGDDSMALGEAAATDRGLTWRSVVNPRNLGSGPTRNAGLAAATGDLVWFLDSDDGADPRFLERMTRALVDHQAQVAACRTLRVDPGGGNEEIDEPAYDREMVSGAEFARDLLTDRYRGWPGNKLFVRSALPQPFFDEGRAYEDFLPTLRSALQSKRVALVSEPLYHYTRTPSSMSAQFASYTTDLFPIADDVRDLLDAAGRLPGWDRELALYRVLNVVMPVANLAVHAQLAGDGSERARQAVKDARALLTREEFRALLADHRWRTAVSMAVLKVSPGLYSRFLQRL